MAEIAEAGSTGARLIDRYAAFGLTHNPFRAPGADDPVCPAFVSRGLPDPPRPGSRTLVQVIGDSGLGKSSQLEAWRNRQPGPMHYIPRRPLAARWAPPPGAGDGTVYGDEIDRMPALRRRRWFRELSRARATVLIGTHADLTNVARRAGLAVVTHRLQPFDRAQVELAIDERLHRAAPGGLRARVFSDADVDRVMIESGGVPRLVDVACHRLLAARVG